MKKIKSRAEPLMKGSVKVLSGNYAAAYGAKVSRAEVISAYPITPQTTVVEKLADMTASGELAAKFVPVESEHSAMGVLIGAASAGARCFTATASQGLALMHELLHWAGRARLPIVLVNCSRELAAPWSLGAAQDDTLSQRDTGWLQFYCESNQEVLDTVIQAYKIGEQVSLPVMLCLDAFFLTHTYEPVSIPDQKMVDKYLPKKDRTVRLNPLIPSAFANDTEHPKLRFELAQSMEAARKIAKSIDEEFHQMFGRSYGVIELYKAEDADTLLVTTATITTTARHVVDIIRQEGKRIGLLKIRMFRPFPKPEIIDALRKVKKIAVIDRDVSYGQGGVFANEVKSALYGQPSRVAVFEFIAGLGGTDVTPETVRYIIDYTLNHDTPEGEPIWIN